MLFDSFRLQIRCWPRILVIVFVGFQHCNAQTCSSEDFSISYNGVSQFVVSSANNTCICNQYLATGGTNVYYGASRFLGGVGAPGSSTAVRGALSVAETASFTGSATFGGGFTGTSGTLSSTLAVNGLSVFNGGLSSTTGTFTNGLLVGGLAAFNGGLTSTTGVFSSTLTTTGPTAFNGGVNATSGAFSTTLAVAGTATFSSNVGIFTPSPSSPLTVVVPGAAVGWDDFRVLAATRWDGATQHATLTGSTGIMLANPHVPWTSANGCAGIRMGLSGGTGSGSWYEVGTGPSNNFFVARGGIASGKQLEVLSSGQVVMASGLTVNGAVTTLNAGLTVAAGATNLNAGLTVTGATRLNGNVGINTAGAGPLDVVLPGAYPGWDRFLVTTSSNWGDNGNQHVHIGTGASGIMISNPHISWVSGNNAATIRMGRSGGVATGSWYEVGVGPSNIFYIGREGQNYRMKIDDNAAASFASSVAAAGSMSAGGSFAAAGTGEFNNGINPCCGPYYTLSVAENTAGTNRVPTIQFHGSGVVEGQLSLTGGGKSTPVGGTYSGYAPSPRTFVFQSVQGMTVDLRVSGTIYGAAKSFVHPHPTQPDKEIVFVAIEGPENGVYIRGKSQLVDGEKTIELPDYFALVASPDGLTSHLTAQEGPCPFLYSASVTPQRIVVRSSVPTDQCKFSYLIQGVRSGYENHEVVRPAFAAANATVVGEKDPEPAASKRAAAAADDDADDATIDLDENV
eukprot:TRINITY_DN492_c0_g1_i2.p1 TRINITY_DN492_c0_g1~~TRINITY_DN492_c0_g1_i2.p1  ORF type:complete len:738 (-),score=257.76 TRINITY_DN492_c0_g1_i2:243-2456(-)